MKETSGSVQTNKFDAENVQAMLQALFYSAFSGSDFITKRKLILELAEISSRGVCTANFWIVLVSMFADDFVS